MNRVKSFLKPTKPFNYLAALALVALALGLPSGYDPHVKSRFEIFLCLIGGAASYMVTLKPTLKFSFLYVAFCALGIIAPLAVLIHFETLNALVGKELWKLANPIYCFVPNLLLYGILAYGGLLVSRNTVR